MTMHQSTFVQNYDCGCLVVLQPVSPSVYAAVGSLLGGTAARFNFVGCPSDRDEKNLTNLNVFFTASKTVHKDFKGTAHLV